ncbi:uncharacterized protein [Nicotiana tomentosiformis]|uniref:uncharacterized protein n=1 Tax=Nicotiana tomentosiformis TaxID=4098 RepID=UPI00388C3E41
MPLLETLRQDIRMIHLTNNEAEYEALIAGLELARELESEVIEIKCDSQLVVNQVYGIFDTKEERMQQYMVKVQDLLAQFEEWSITHIPREDNAEADALANLGSSIEIQGLESGMVVQLMNSTLDTDGYYVVNSTSLVWDWRNEIIDYLEHGKLPEDPKASRVLCAKAARYSFNKGDGHHQTITVGSWKEEGPYQKIGECKVVDFLWKNIICRFGISKEIACDNGSQFIGTKVTKFLEDLKINRTTSSPYHPSTNDQAESTNKVIIQNLKKRLEAAKGNWPEELPGVLWAYRTTAKSRTGDTPFSLVYGAEALILVEVGEQTLRYFEAGEGSNNEAMLINL